VSAPSATGRIAWKGAALSAGACAALLGTAGEASAQPACGGSNLFIEGPGLGHGATSPLALAQFFADSLRSAPDVKVLYTDSPTCFAQQDLLDRTSTSNGALAFSLSPNQAPGLCIFDRPVPPDLVITEVSPQTCAQTTGRPTLADVSAASMAIRDVYGPVQITGFVVPQASTEMSISADAAYVVLGFGGAMNEQVAPWTDPTRIVVTSQAGPVDLVSAAIGLVPITKWQKGSSGSGLILPNPWTGALPAMLTDGVMPKDINATLGIYPTEWIDTQPGILRTLAYQAAGQTCGYLPDSDANHRDRINVRQGRYTLWSPLHVLAAVDVTGQVIDHTGARNSALSAIVSYLQSTGPTPPMAPSEAGAEPSDEDTGAPDAPADAPGDAFSDASSDAADSAAAGPVFDDAAYITAMNSAGLIPWCAMQVVRTEDLGAEASFQPAQPCGCLYESLRGETLATCMACRSDADCNAAQPTCRFGYCEVQ
jgi:hypothetical protein